MGSEMCIRDRAKITESIGVIPEIYEIAPMSVGLSLFKDAKLDELVNIYSKAPQAEREKVFNMLQMIYPTEHERLNKIKTGQEKQ